MTDETTGRAKGGVKRAQVLTSEQRKRIAIQAAAARWASKNPENTSTSEILIYQTEDKNTKIDVRLEDESVWLTQAQMADLFQTTRQNATAHIRNIFAEGELIESAVSKDSLLTANDGKSYQTKLYNLDVIISVGYRVKSPRGTQFRIWATQKIREYIVKGFTLDDDRLKNAGTRDDYFDELIRRVREIRTSEKNLYKKITRIYALSIDYDSKSPLTQDFFKIVQNKMHYAITGHTAAELKAKRADANQPNMGLTSWDGEHIRKSDVYVAKNYLKREEIESLTLLVDQYLSFAEFQAKQRRPMHMTDWIKKLDDFLKLNEQDILTHAGSISTKISDEIVAREYDKFHMRQKAIESETDISDFDQYVRQLEVERYSPSKDSQNDEQDGW